MRKVSLVAALLLLAPAVSQAKTLEELLVEKGVITKSEAGRVADSGPAKLYYNEGTRFEFPDTGFSAQLNTLVQTRYTFTDNDDDSGLRNTSSFDVARARLAVSGSALHNEFTYKLEANFYGENDQGFSNTPELLDAWIKWNACDWGGVKMGQFKTMFNRQFQTAPQNLQFADRSLVSQYFTLGRQQGLAGDIKALNDKLHFQAGIFNGVSDGEGLNSSGVDTNHTGVASVRYDALGSMDAFQESDVNWTDKPALSVGASYAYSDANADVGAGTENVDAHSVSADANFRLKGISLNAEFFYTSVRPDIVEKSEPLGFYGQAGYFLIPKKLEVAARYGFLDCDNGKALGECAGLDNLNEVGAGVNYYWWKNQMKAQLGYDLQNRDIQSGGGDINTNRWLLQLSSYF